ncbi:hypothetical protein JNB11_04915 [Kocuria palustris]|nr:hypothetical protein [Kocuria palustris]
MTSSIGADAGLWFRDSGSGPTSKRQGQGGRAKPRGSPNASYSVRLTPETG